MPAIELTASDGHRFGAWRADPEGTPKGGIVVLQEVFGVNRHIRRVTEDYAKHGFAAIAPALFDRLERDVELGYDQDGFSKAIPLMTKLDPAGALLDIEAAITALAPAGKVATTGYCMGGRLSWVSAAKLPIAAAVCYYGGGIGRHLDLKPRCPVMLHFGELDSHIPMTEVEEIRKSDPALIVYTYPAGHGFNCEDRGDYDPASAELALERSLAFLSKELAV